MLAARRRRCSACNPCHPAGYPDVKTPSDLLNLTAMERYRCKGNGVACAAVCCSWLQAHLAARVPASACTHVLANSCWFCLLHSPPALLQAEELLCHGGSAGPGAAGGKSAEGTHGRMIRHTGAWRLRCACSLGRGCCDSLHQQRCYAPSAHLPLHLHPICRCTFTPSAAAPQARLPAVGAGHAGLGAQGAALRRLH